MNSEQLFQLLGDVDDAYILEAEEDSRRPVVWKIAVAAVAAVAIGTVWFTFGTLKRPAPEAGPSELAAPVVTTEPDAPDETTPPVVSPEPSVPDNTAAPVIIPGPSVPGETTAPVVIPGPSGSGDTPPPDVQPSDPVVVPSDPPVQTPPPVIVPGTPNLPGSAWPGLPGFGGASVPFKGVYYHSAAGDYLVFRSPVLGMPVVTVNITGQIVDGHYEGTVSVPFGQSFYVELQVHEDGSYDLYY